MAGLVALLRCGTDSAGQAAARAIKNLSAGQGNTAKVRPVLGLRGQGADVVGLGGSERGQMVLGPVLSAAEAAQHDAGSTQCCPPAAPPLQVCIAESGAIPLLVRLLASPKDATRRAAASGALPVSSPAALGRRRCKIACMSRKNSHSCLALWLGFLAAVRSSRLPPSPLLVLSASPDGTACLPAPLVPQPCGTWRTATTPTARRLCRRAPSRPSSSCWR